MGVGWQTHLLFELCACLIVMASVFGVNNFIAGPPHSIESSLASSLYSSNFTPVPGSFGLRHEQGASTAIRQYILAVRRDGASPTTMGVMGRPDLYQVTVVPKAWI